jgi:hypothetical protein
MGPPLYMVFMWTEMSLCGTYLYLSWLQQTSSILINILHNSRCTHRNELHFIRWLHPSSKFSIKAIFTSSNRNILIIRQWPSWQFLMNTVLEATHPCPVPHIEYKAVLLLQMSHVWSRNVGTFF